MAGVAEQRQHQAAGEDVDRLRRIAVEALGTRPGARTIAFDEKTRKLYTLVAEGSADFDKKINTGVGPFYPNTYFPDTLQVLTYGRK